MIKRWFLLFALSCFPATSNAFFAEDFFPHAEKGAAVLLAPATMMSFIAHESGNESFRVKAGLAASCARLLHGLLACYNYSDNDAIGKYHVGGLFLNAVKCLNYAVAYNIVKQRELFNIDNLDNDVLPPKEPGVDGVTAALGLGLGIVESVLALKAASGGEVPLWKAVPGKVVVSDAKGSFPQLFSGSLLALRLTEAYCHEKNENIRLMLAASLASNLHALFKDYKDWYYFDESFQAQDMSQTDYQALVEELARKLRLVPEAQLVSPENVRFREAFDWFTQRAQD